MARQLDSYWLDPNAQKRVEYDLNDGPVIVESDCGGVQPGVKKIAAMRDAWKLKNAEYWQPDGQADEFPELMGFPRSSSRLLIISRPTTISQASLDQTVKVRRPVRLLFAHEFYAILDYVYLCIGAKLNLVN